LALVEIIEYPDQRLRSASVPVVDFDAGIGGLVDDLVDTLHASNAIALCAPQIDDGRQVLVMDLSGDRSRPEHYINPRILERSQYGIVEESCLSVPGVVVNVLRATRVRVSAFDLAGSVFERELAGLEAVCLQHEMDHFSGKLLVDRLNWFRRRRLKAVIDRKRREIDGENGSGVDALPQRLPSRAQGGDPPFARE
jgi:peptide deformylase